MSHGKHGSSHLHSDPDRGKPMHEGEMPFDKGYHEQHGNDSAHFPETHERGNNYAKMQSEIKSKDAKKLAASKRSKF